MTSAPSIPKNNLGVPSISAALAGLALSHDGNWLWLAHSADPARSASELLGEPGALVVTLWELGSGRALGRITTEPVMSPVLVAVGNRRQVLVAHDDGAWLLDLETREQTALPLLKRDFFHGPPHIDAAGTLGTVEAEIDDVSRLVRVDLRSGRVALDLADSAAPFAFSLDDKWLCYAVTADEGKILRIVRAQDGSVVASSPPSERISAVDALALDETGRMVAWHGHGQVGIWRMGEAPKTQRLSSGGETEPPALQFAPGGRTLYCLYKGSVGQLQTVDTQGSQEEMRRIAYEMQHGKNPSLGQLLGPVRLAVLSTSGTSAVVATYDLLTHYTLSEGSAARGTVVARPAIDCCAFLPRLGYVVSGSRHSREVTCRKPGSSEDALVFDAGCEGVRELHTAADGASLYIIGMDGSISHFAPTRTPAVVRWACPYVYTSLFTIAPGGSRAVCTHGNVDGSRGRGYTRGLPPEKQDSFTVWDLRSGRLLADLKDVPAPAQAIAWIGGSANAVRVRSGTQLTTHDVTSGRELDSVFFPLDWCSNSPDAQLWPGGDRVLTVEDERLVVWDLKTESTIVDVAAAEGTHLLAIDARGTRAVLSTRESKVAIHRLDRDRHAVIQLDGEPATVAAWSPAGDKLMLITMSQRLVIVAT